ncbi:hypothetical protein EDC38_2488 [Marinimicrobium koreense]|uniref:Uncharacterized protein n=1 Tax=Marinimicrobium koreense TaxID=306545 RepID=A0A3N1P561_9GAMM|nr:hypothetical protein [Marinimicrobium koreense]ROQ21860.1 hypothetical protein EDC38_2488 [Marinimicrobium koreense]
MKLKLLAALMLGSTLVACGGSSGGGGGGGGNDDPDDIPQDDPPEEGTQIEIQAETLPLVENFEATSTLDFFSDSYKALNTPASNTIVDEDGNESTLTDPHPSFYYPTCCLWAEDPDTGEVSIGEVDPESTSWMAGNGYLALIDSARMSIGQILSDLTDENANDRKSDTSDGAEGATAELGSWGELDLSEPYRVSFCLNDNGPWGSGFSNLELYVDNNSGGRQADSLWSTASLLLREEIGTFQAGNRVVVDVPGDAYMMDNEGNRVGDTIAVIPALDGDSMPVGTSTSYLQLRVSSGGYAVISNLVVEHQAGDAVEYATCEVNEEYVQPPQFEGVAFEGLPLSVNLDMTFEEFFGEENEIFLAFPDDLTKPFYNPRAGSSRMYVANNAITWGDGRFYVGHDEGTGLEAVGGIDLSQPYTVSFTVNKANDAGGNFMIYVNNTESGTGSAEDGWNSVHEDATTIYSATLDTLTDGQEVVIESDVGTATSFFQFRCDSGCGQPEGPDSELGITLSDIVIQYQDSNGGDAGLINEAFEGITSEDFYSTEYRHVSTDASTSFYYETGGTTAVVDGVLSFDSSRITAGDRTRAATTSETTEPQGDMDLSQPFRIQFDVVAVNTVPVEEDATANFFVYLDNNTTSSSNSLHDFDSRIVNVDSRTYEAGQTYVYEITENLGTTESFLQFRCESGCAIDIDNLIVEPM